MKKSIKRFFYFLGILFLLFVSCITTLDKTAYSETSFYKKTTSSIEKNALFVKDTISPVKIGCAKQNITPSFPTEMAGYGNRGKFTSVHDSLFVRTFFFEQQKQQYAIITFDLIMLHTDLKNAIIKKVQENNQFKNIKIYFSATHSHSSIGGWAKGTLAKFTLGGYDQKVVDLLVEKTIKTIEKASQKTELVQFTYSKTAVSDYVKNRIVDTAYADTYLRTIFFKTPTKTATLTTFSAHPTNLHFRSTEVSADYPAYFIQEMEKTVDFSMFCAGGIGSHCVSKDLEQKHQNIQEYGKELAKFVSQSIDTVSLEPLKNIFYHQIPIEVRDVHLRIHPEIRLRPWLFNLLYKIENIEIVTLQLNQLNMIGTPCDFSGELVPLIEKNVKTTNPFIVTSFNGNYIGYVNHPKHYYQDDNEINQMTWLGEDNGYYFVEIMTKIINKLN